jgi:prophage regulatory protein
MIMTISNQPSILILRLNKLSEKIGLGKSAIYDRLDKNSPRHDPNFPTPIDLGRGKNPPVGWVSAEVDDWLSIQIQKSRGATTLSGDN